MSDEQVPEKKKQGMRGPKKRAIFNTPPVLKSKLQARLDTPVKPLRKQKKVVSAKEWKFVMELVSGDGRITQKEAAIRAGWTPGSASEAASRMTNPARSPHIVAAIQEYRAELAAKYASNYDRHMRDMQDIRDAALAAGAFGAAVSAEYRRGQAVGTIYVDRKEIRVGTIDSMSREEVMAKLEQLRQLYGGAPRSIIDMTPEEIVESGIQPAAQARALPLLDKLADDEKARRIAAYENTPMVAARARHKARVEGRIGDTGLPDSAGEGGLDNAGAEGGDEGQEG